MDDFWQMISFSRNFVFQKSFKLDICEKSSNVIFDCHPNVFQHICLSKVFQSWHDLFQKSFVLMKSRMTFGSWYQFLINPTWFCQKSFRIFICQKSFKIISESSKWISFDMFVCQTYFKVDLIFSKSYFVLMKSWVAFYGWQPSRMLSNSILSKVF